MVRRHRGKSWRDSHPTVFYSGHGDLIPDAPAIETCKRSFRVKALLAGRTRWRLRRLPHALPIIASGRPPRSVAADSTFGGSVD